MKWTTPDDVKKVVMRMWERGDILSSLLSGELLFPKRIPFRKPTSGEILENFGQVREWSRRLCSMSQVRVELRSVRHRVFGQNELPAELWIDAVAEAVKLIGKQPELQSFEKIVADTRSRCSQLLVWLEKRPLKALEIGDDWCRLIDLCIWIKDHPRPRIYLRQVSLPGIHSKFIEEHRAVLAELFDIILEPKWVNSKATGIGKFCERFGFLSKPHTVRFRILDLRRQLMVPSGITDATLDAKTFEKLDPEGVDVVFVTENEINFLAFPELERSMVLFGAGYGFEALKSVEWLRHKRILYWGDIDTHGFAILNQIRGYLPHVESFLMNRSTLLDSKCFWGKEPTQIIHDLSRLNDDELEVYNELRDNRIQKHLRLEQERISYDYFVRFLRDIVAGASP